MSHQGTIGSRNQKKSKQAGLKNVIFFEGSQARRLFIRGLNTSSISCMSSPSIVLLASTSAFVVQIFRKPSKRVSLAQDEFERELRVADFTLQILDAVLKAGFATKQMCWPAKTIEGELMQEMDDVFKPRMKRRRACGPFEEDHVL